MAQDIFIQIDGAPGESTDSAHTDWIEVSSFSLGANQATSGEVSTGGSQTSGRVQIMPVRFTHVLDKSHPKLQQLCANGTHVDNVKLEVCRAGGDKRVYYTLTMTKVLISKVELIATPGTEGTDTSTLPMNADLPTEEVELRPTTIKWSYTETKKDGTAGGTVEAGWDQEANKEAS